MSPSLRKFALSLHVIASVGLLGSIAAFLALAFAGLTSQDIQMIRAAYLAMDWTANAVIVPLALASVLTGLILSLSTPWGLFRHYWIVTKLFITVFATVVLLAKIEMIAYAAGLATQTILSHAELRAVGIELLIHATAGLLVLLVPAVLSIYKPRGVTPYGRRMQEEQCMAPQQVVLPSANSAVESTSIWSIGGSTASTLRRTNIAGIAVVIIFLHFIVLHLLGIGPGGH